MSLTDFLISTTEYVGKDISGLADTPNMEPAELKARFDSLVKSVVVTKYNGLVNALNSTADGLSGADNVRATAISGLTGTSVQALLESLNTLKAPKANPTFTGSLTAPVITASTNFAGSVWNLGNNLSINNIDGTLVVQGYSVNPMQLRADMGIVCTNAVNNTYVPVKAKSLTLLHSSMHIALLNETTGGDDGFTMDVYGGSETYPQGILRFARRLNGSYETGSNIFTHDPSSGKNAMLPVYTITTATAANVNVDSAGALMRSTSSRRYKTDIIYTDKEKTRAELNAMAARCFKSLCASDNPDKIYTGFISEELEAVNPNMVLYSIKQNGEKQVEGFDQNEIISRLLEGWKMHEAEILELRGIKQ